MCLPVHRLRSLGKTFDGNENCLAHKLILIRCDKPIKHLYLLITQLIIIAIDALR